MPSDDPQPGCCAAHVKQGDGYCIRSPINGTGRCRLHGGASTGPRDPSTLEGNDHAVGNPGGGAPEGNCNAARHHGWADPLKHYHRLTGDARAHADTIVDCLVADYALVHDVAPEAAKAEAELLAELRRLAAISNQCICANAAVFEEGIVVDREREYETADGETVSYTAAVPNPALEADLRLSSKRRAIRGRIDLALPDVIAAEKEQRQREQLEELLANVATDTATGDGDDVSAAADDVDEDTERPHPQGSPRAAEPGARAGARPAVADGGRPPGTGDSDDTESAPAPDDADAAEPSEGDDDDDEDGVIRRTVSGMVA